MIPAMVALYDFNGFLRWNYTVWPEDPRRELRFSRFEAGDTNFVYPAYNGDVLLSLRYKSLRRGIADYELACAVAARNGEKECGRYFDPLLYVKEPYAYYEAIKNGTLPLHSTEWEDFNTVKTALLEALK